MENNTELYYTKEDIIHWNIPSFGVVEVNARELDAVLSHVTKNFRSPKSVLCAIRWDTGEQCLVGAISPTWLEVSAIWIIVHVGWETCQ